MKLETRSRRLESLRSQIKLFADEEDRLRAEAVAAVHGAEAYRAGIEALVKSMEKGERTPPLSRWQTTSFSY